MRTNTSRSPVSDRTFQGAPVAMRLSVETELRRAVFTCLLWEKEFYREGHETANRIVELAKQLPFETVAQIAIDARTKYKLRHVPLWLLVGIINAGHKGNQVSELIANVIQRSDEMAELIALYWKNGKRPMTKQLRKGLAKAFAKFNEYQLAKFDRPGAVSLRDVMFLCHPVPANEERAVLQHKVANKQLATPDTWETQLSAGADKATTFVRLIGERKLGPQALLKNLRNMAQAGVHADVIKTAIKNMNTERVLPFEFLTAARHAPQFEHELEEQMFKCLDTGSIKGETVLLVDNSGSMAGKVSSKSELSRYDAAACLAMLLKEECEHLDVYTFNDESPVYIKPRRGFALRDAMGRANGGTLIGKAVAWAQKNTKHDRLIVLTDEQSGDTVPNNIGLSYMINVATYEKTVGYGNWVRISGWSEAVVDFIRTYEKEGT